MPTAESELKSKENEFIFYISRSSHALSNRFAETG
jgi:hypothetical protein